jgi:crotonobetainyl-CoA:carnitine CoA-transferase CaiB-like acyl-CoA transferase
LFDVMVDWMTPILLAEQYGGGVPDPSRLRHPSIVPYGAFETSDRQLVNLAVQNESEWKRFCHTVLQDPALATDPHFATNVQRVEARAVLATRIEKSVRTLTADELIRRLELAHVPWGRINTARDVLNHRQLIDPARWSQIRLPNARQVSVISFPTQKGVLPDGAIAEVPRVGQHTDAILRELGYSAETLSGVYEDGVVSNDAAGLAQSVRGGAG